MINPLLKANRPAMVDANIKTISFRKGSDLDFTIETILAEQYVMVDGQYALGLELLHELQLVLKSRLSSEKDNDSKETFLEQRVYRKSFRFYSHFILLQIRQHQLTVKKSPEIGWLKKLYPEQTDFILPFPDVQGLNSSWQWYLKGITIPVLRNKIHPYYGVYFPTRFEHLFLLDNWLNHYSGPKKTAIDVGVGSGVLSFLLVKHEFQKVFATDINVNAIIGLTELMGETKLSRKIETDFASLFGKWEKPTELIVFNPPWLPATQELENLDEAIYYDEKLFPVFFAEAKKRLLPDGKIVLLFSNLAQVTAVSEIHPIEQELAEGGRFQLERCIRKPVKKASDKTKRDQYWRSEEMVELWVLGNV
ncbi:MAG: methyltransferase [Pelobium sp.]